jgi:hypothetical protein
VLGHRARRLRLDNAFALIEATRHPSASLSVGITHPLREVRRHLCIHHTIGALNRGGNSGYTALKVGTFHNFRLVATGIQAALRGGVLQLGSFSV